MELFSGTGSVGQVARALGFEVVSVDIDDTWKPDICKDIRKLRPEEIYNFCNRNVINVVWASPDCSQYSHLRNCMPHIPRNIARSNEIVMATLSLIRRINPFAWFLENPATGKLKDQHFIKNIEYKDCCYCRYNKSLPFKKHTRIWGKGVQHWNSPKMCKTYSNLNAKSKLNRMLQAYGKTCAYYKKHGSHKYSVGSYKRRNLETSNISKTERLKIPSKLLHNLLHPIINELQNHKSGTQKNTRV